MRVSKVLGAAAVVAAACLTSTVARADLTNGLLTLSGVLYVEGLDPVKVKCSSSDGNTLDSAGVGVRIFHLVPSCQVWTLTGAADTFQFDGQEFFENSKGSYVFSGLQNPAASGMVGAAGGVLKCTGGPCTKEQGTINLSYYNGSKFVFIGKYKAKFLP